MLVNVKTPDEFGVYDVPFRDNDLINPVILTLPEVSLVTEVPYTDKDLINPFMLMLPEESGLTADPYTDKDLIGILIVILTLPFESGDILELFKEIDFTEGLQLSATYYRYIAFYIFGQ